MPGLLGIATRGDPTPAAERFDKARDRMLRHPGLAATTVIATNRRCMLANIQLARLSTTPAVADDLAEVVFHGVLQNKQALRHELDATEAEGIETLLARLYCRHGVGFVDSLRGEFVLALLDEKRQQVLIATDTVGTHPIYWSSEPGVLIFSSDLSAVLRAAPAAARLDMKAVADYVTIGAVLGDKTLAAGVQLLDPGTVLVYDLHTGSIKQHCYHHIASFFGPAAASRTDYTRAVQSSFAAAVNRSIAGGGRIGLSLSGGLDSRAILSAVNGRSGALQTYTLGVEGCADQVIARQLASVAGSPHIFFPLDKSYLRDFLPNMAEMVSLTDGMYLSHGLTEMLAVKFLDRTSVEVLLRGHGGELGKARLAWPLHTDDHVYRLGSAAELVPYLSDRANYITRGLALSRFLVPEAARLAGLGARTSFAEALDGTHLSPAQCCSYLYLRELSRRFTVPSLELFRTRVEVRLPFIDREFLTVLLASPPEWRDDTSIHKALTALGIPKLLRVRNSNTGAPADAGPLAEFVLDKANTVLKRLNVYGFRHYHDFDGWMRHMLLESVERELMSPQARVAGFVDLRGVAELVRDTRTGSADRAYLLQILLILELWMRENNVNAFA